MAGMVEVVASTVGQIARLVEQMVEVKALAGIVVKDQIEPSVRLSAELATAERTLPKMDQFASVAAAVVAAAV